MGNTLEREIKNQKKINDNLMKYKENTDLIIIQNAKTKLEEKKKSLEEEKKQLEVNVNELEEKKKN